MTSRSWCLTIHCERLEAPEGVDHLRYMVWQKERCPETGRIHQQVYIELSSPHRIGWVQGLWELGKFHCERRRGSREQARDYCMKEESRVEGPWEFGEWIVGRGHRSDIAKAVELVREGADDLTLVEEVPETFVRYYRGLDRVRQALLEERSTGFREVKVYVLIGPAGSGKTRSVFKDHPDLYSLPPVEGGKLWFDGYRGQDVLLIDDFYEEISHAQLLRILDGYKMQVPYKGGFTWACWTTVYITSNEWPDTWYQGGVTAALKRRFTEVKEVTRSDG